MYMLHVSSEDCNFLQVYETSRHVTDMRRLENYLF